MISILDKRLYDFLVHDKGMDSQLAAMEAGRWYQAFKAEVIAGMEDEWTLDGETVRQSLSI